MNENAFKVLDFISEKKRIPLNSTTSKSLGLGWDEFLKQIEYLENNEYISEVEFGNNEYSITEIGQLNLSEFLKKNKTKIEQATHPIEKPINKNPILSILTKYWWAFVVPLIVGIILIMIEKGIIDITNLFSD
tara:strand:+ start:1318 stop:1716 length:399 start_codon:yes stop_codon:yes gene_type:complete